jgi:hypothetical protein
MKLRWLIAPIAASLVLLAFAACGGDDDNASTSASASATATATDSSDETKTPKPSTSAKKTATPKPTDEDGTATPDDTGTLPDDTTPEINECDLLTTDELDAALNGTFDDGELSGDTCTFTGDNGTSVDVSTFDLSAYGEGNEKEIFETFASIFEVDILDSPGDEAYYDDTIGLSVLHGHYELDVVVTLGDGSSNKDATFALAEKALDRMP